jgi:hypothetical protein
LDALGERAAGNDGLEADLLDAVARGEAIDAHAVMLLLQRYRQSPRDVVADAVGQALARALDQYALADATLVRASWLTTFADAADLSDDERLLEAIGHLTSELRGAWTSARADESAAAVGACLTAVRLDRFQSIAPAAVDALERIVARSYRPGAGLGAFAADVRTAGALLTAYVLSGRLPYSMLAEELMQPSDRGDAADFDVTCGAARVLCRLAALHADAEYRAAAIVAPGARYLDDAERLMGRCADEAARRGTAGAIYALAQLELESLRSAHPKTI